MRKTEKERVVKKQEGILPRTYTDMLNRITGEYNYDGRNIPEARKFALGLAYLRLEKDDPFGHWRQATEAAEKEGDWVPMTRILESSSLVLFRINREIGIGLQVLALSLIEP